VNIFILAGPKGSGKDASFELLQEQGVVKDKLAFADPLKHLCATTLNIPLEYMHDPELKEKPLPEPVVLRPAVLRKLKDAMPKYLDPSDPAHTYRLDKVAIQNVEGIVCDTPRKLLQVVGTDFIRNLIYKDWHINAAFGLKWLNIAGKRPKKGDVFAVTDARFLNEFEFLAGKFPELKAFYVERPEAEEKLANATHSSELEVKKIRKAIVDGGHTVVQNNGTLKDLGTRLKDLLK
jgi:hypothetical protein